MVTDILDHAEWKASDYRDEEKWESEHIQPPVNMPVDLDKTLWYSFPFTVAGIPWTVFVVPCMNTV